MLSICENATAVGIYINALTLENNSCLLGGFSGGFSGVISGVIGILV